MRALAQGTISFKGFMMGVLADIARQQAALSLTDYFSVGTKTGALDSALKIGASALGISGFRELGGPVSAGQAYVVGEKRPEIFIPNQSGTILPNTNMGSQADQQQPQTIHIVNAPQITTGAKKEDVLSALSQSNRELASMVGELINRNQGGLRTIIKGV